MQADVPVGHKAIKLLRHFETLRAENAALLRSRFNYDASTGTFSTPNVSISFEAWTEAQGARINCLIGALGAAYMRQAAYRAPISISGTLMFESMIKAFEQFQREAVPYIILRHTKLPRQYEMSPFPVGWRRG